MLGLSKIVDLSCGKVEEAASRNEDTMHAEMLRSWSRTYCTEMTMFSCTPLNQGLANPVINISHMPQHTINTAVFPVLSFTFRNGCNFGLGLFLTKCKSQPAPIPLTRPTPYASPACASSLLRMRFLWKRTVAPISISRASFASAKTSGPSCLCSSSLKSNPSAKTGHLSHAIQYGRYPAIITEC
jgi:hypothetical protein